MKISYFFQQTGLRTKKMLELKTPDFKNELRKNRLQSL